MSVGAGGPKVRTRSFELEGYDAIILRVSVGGIDRGAEITVLSDEIFFRDPTGTAAESSNSDPDFL